MFGVSIKENKKYLTIMTDRKEIKENKESWTKDDT
jgi:hypothetical protein